MKRIVSNFSLLTVASIVFLLIAEVAARFLLPDIPEIKIAENKLKQPEFAPEIDLPTSPDQGLYYQTDTGKRIKPNITATIGENLISKNEVVIRTNSYGFRGAEIEDDQKKRILFLGDSVTLADYLNEEDTFVSLVEQYAQNDGLSWRTINAGVGSIGLQNEVAILVEQGLKLNPEVIVLNFYLNDFEESPGVWIQHYPKWLKKSYFFYHLNHQFNLFKIKQVRINNEQINHWKNLYLSRVETEAGEGFGYRDNPKLFNYLVAENFYDWGIAWSREAWKEVGRPLIKKVHSLAKENNSKLLIVVHPVSLQVDSKYVNNYPQRKMQEIASELEIPILDLLPVIRKHYKLNNQVLFYDPCHHTELGSEVVAKEIYQFITSQVT